MPNKRTYADRAEYLKQAVSKRRKKLKELLVEYKGGKCAICGYNRYVGAFDLHHVEADKCILLCANCHREVHGGITQLPRGNSGQKTR